MGLTDPEVSIFMFFTVSKFTFVAFAVAVKADITASNHLILDTKLHTWRSYTLSSCSMVDKQLKQNV